MVILLNTVSGFSFIIEAGGKHFFYYHACRQQVTLHYIYWISYKNRQQKIETMGR